VGLAAAAAVLLAVTVAHLQLSGDAALARARQRGLLEETCYEQGRAELAAGRFDPVRRRCLLAERAGARSSRLRNLALQARGQRRDELALARGSLLELGYTLDGVAPRKGDPALDLSPQLDELERDWAQAVAAYPGDARLRVNCGAFLLGRGKHPEATREFRAALERDPRSVGAWMGLGLSAYEREQFGLALEHFQAVLRLEPTHPGGHLNAAMTLERLGRKEAARLHWQRARQRTSDPALRQRIAERSN
jgi:tetratricopeptide (TPR) repeat protein